MPESINKWLLFRLRNELTEPESSRRADDADSRVTVDAPGERESDYSGYDNRCRYESLPYMIHHSTLQSGLTKTTSSDCTRHVTAPVTPRSSRFTSICLLSATSTFTFFTTASE